MAGESPDKSEQRKSSGETTRGERDPRLAVFHEGEAGGGKSAVAVADEEPEAAAEAEREAESAVRESESSDSAESDKSVDGAQSSGESDEKAAEGSVEESGESDEGASGEPVDRRTAVFRTLKREPDGKAVDEKASPESDSDGQGSDGEDSDAPVDRPTAAFGVLRHKEAPRWAQKADKTDDSVDAEERATDSGKTDEADKADKADEGGEKGGDPAVGTGIDRPTAVFKTLKTPAEDKPAADKPADGNAAEAKPADAKVAEKPAAKPAEKPAGKPGEKDEKKAPGAERPEGGHHPAVAGGAAERTSRFVPLRSADAPPTRPPVRPSAQPALPESERTKQQPLPESERTKQQPLPPVGQPAPLDLLAQLTNTPPPAETPLRTAVRRVKIWTPLAVLLIIVLGVVQSVRPLPDPELKVADATYTFDGARMSLPWPEQGQSAVEVEGLGSLGTSGAQKPVPIASVTKVMTAYVVLKEHPLKVSEEGPTIKIDAQAGKESGSEDESRVEVDEGQTYNELQMLQMLLIPSGNNIARQLARWDSGSEEAFVKKMNDAAKDLGMKNTVYTDPSGFKATTKSTASDQLKLARAVMKSEAFRSVVATPNIRIPGLKTPDSKIYNNNNLLVKPGVVGIKTGSSTPAGGALMWGAEKTVDGNKRLILGVVLQQRAPGILQNSLDLVQTNSYKLITAVQDGLTSATVAKKGDVVGHVDDGLGGTTPVVATKDVTAVGWGGLEVELELIDGGKVVPHTAKAGTVVGQLAVGSGSARVKVPVALQNDLSEPSFGSKLVRIA
ncbi:putative D-alanyl-D-alanine carboxypeptidase [Streptomyces bingchenggensis BCW-1]|uniref:Putative D-alanyl-D-alanine carboxypeptidase n=1 Tax=Streptomyces bingchenggensis (strain BCW-1) TaxID=749414 RepID=D7BSF0_STRBB|nr:MULTISPECIES: D-alanyl-D-alanine carboxypeptidase [Streptomyces]ADI09468.1 putative D-alanyl-D-alanine carboxypeptidase [Streptomyces bingchenggensis BCW-1]